MAQTQVRRAVIEAMASGLLLTEVQGQFEAYAAVVQLSQGPVISTYRIDLALPCSGRQLAVGLDPAS